MSKDVVLPEKSTTTRRLRLLSVHCEDERIDRHQEVGMGRRKRVSVHVTDRSIESLQATLNGMCTYNHSLMEM